MLYIFLTMGLLALSIFAVFNTYVFALALKNCVRLDGSVSWKRVRKEIKHLLRYLSVIVLTIALLIGLIYVAANMVHTYLIPLDIVDKVFSLFHANPVEWEEAIKEGPMGNLDQQFEDWSAHQGYAPDTPEIWADILFQNWLSILAMIAALVALLYFAQIKWFAALTAYYEKNTLMRRKAYYHRDRARARAQVDTNGDAEITDGIPPKADPQAGHSPVRPGREGTTPQGKAGATDPGMGGEKTAS